MKPVKLPPMQMSVASEAITRASLKGTTLISRVKRSTTPLRSVCPPPVSSRPLSMRSPVPNFIDEQELLGDEEMMHNSRLRQAELMGKGTNQRELYDLSSFPDTLPAGTPLSPECMSHLSHI